MRKLKIARTNSPNSEACVPEATVLPVESVRIILRFSKVENVPYQEYVFDT